MMKILHTFILIALAANVHSSTERIVGGVLADPNAIPYQVALLPRKVKSSIPLLCGGSLVSAGAVLTAAHCLKNTEKTFVSIGAHNLTDREKGIYTTWVNASDYRVHPHFNLEYAHNDIALVILRKIVEFSDQIKHVALPSTDESFAGEIGTVSGFGNTCDDCGPSLILKVARNKILENEECSKLLGTIAVPSSTQICTTTAETKSGICRGDSGGPLTIIRNETVVQVGISSFGFAKCAEGNPSIFTRLTSDLVKWMQTEMSNEEANRLEV